MNAQQRDRPWWKDAVIYQIYPRSFMDGNGDGTGDLAGITSRLDYLVWLGINAIWISPIYRSPMVDFGYDVEDYCDVDPLFGTLTDFDELLIQAHAKGLRVIMDFVPNHTSDRHQWFQEARQSRDSERRDWYVWRDPSADGGPPNNWMSYFGGQAWTYDATTGQYYLHNFAPEQPELNWRNPDVESAMHQQMRFWLDRGVDGFRLDVIDRLIKDAGFQDNPPHPEWRNGDDPSWRFLRVHSERQPEVMDIIKRMRRMMDEYDGNRVMIGEVAYDLPVEQLIVHYGTPPYEGANPDGMHLPFNFGLFDIPWNAAAIKHHIDTYESLCPSFAVPNYVLGNHDKPRMASSIGPEQAHVAAMLLLTLRGVPTLYYGDEIGMENVPVPQDQVQDPMGLGTTVFNRDECRSPMQWDSGPHAGFCPGEVSPWLPVPANATEVNVESERDDDGSFLSLYHRLLKFRRDSDALKNGTYEPREADEGLFVFVRRSETEVLLVVLNFTNQELAYHDASSGTVVASTHRTRNGDIDLSTMSIGPHEGLVIGLA